MPKKRELPPNSDAVFPPAAPIDLDSKGAQVLRKRATDKTEAEDRKRDALATGRKRFTEGK
jgi:hypothetical protein